MDVTQCNLVGNYRRFGGAYCIHLQGRIKPSLERIGYYSENEDGSQGSERNN
jgi:hypothetical protein